MGWTARRRLECRSELSTEAHNPWVLKMVQYHRIPITPDRSLEPSYLDAYLSILIRTTPGQSAVVFSCGTGAANTTFGMVAAALIRRGQLMAAGVVDPFTTTTGLATASKAGTPIMTPTPGMGAATPTVSGISRSSAGISPSNEDIPLATTVSVAVSIAVVA
jgi:hypothetical protein